MLVGIINRPKVDPWDQLGRSSAGFGAASRRTLEAREMPSNNLGRQIDGTGGINHQTIHAAWESHPRASRKKLASPADYGAFHTTTERPLSPGTTH